MLKLSNYLFFLKKVHPWFAHNLSTELKSVFDDEWIQKLRFLLEKYPSSIIGEIGLDKVARTPETKKNEIHLQIPIFEAQVKLATQLNRPISVMSKRNKYS